MSCTNLFKQIYVRAMFWGYGIFGALLNIISFISCFYMKKDSVQLYRLFINFSDFLTSFYTTSLASVDFYFNKVFIQHSHEWKNSIFCLLLGCLLRFSIINSLLTLLTLTLERFLAIVYPFNVDKFQKYRLIVLMSTNILAIFLSIFPLVFFYQVNIFKL